MNDTDKKFYALMRQLAEAQKQINELRVTRAKTDFYDEEWDILTKRIDDLHELSKFILQEGNKYLNKPIVL